MVNSSGRLTRRNGRWHEAGKVPENWGGESSGCRIHGRVRSEAEWLRILQGTKASGVEMGERESVCETTSHSGLLARGAEVTLNLYTDVSEIFSGVVIQTVPTTCKHSHNDGLS